MKAVIVFGSVLLVMMIVISIPCYEEQHYKETHPGWGNYEFRNSFVDEPGITDTTRNK